MTLSVVAGGRGSGKTSAAVEWVRRGRQTHRAGWSRVLVVHSQSEAARLCRTFGLDQQQVMTADTWRRHGAGSGDCEVAVDNAELLVHEALGLHGRLGMVTLGGDVLADLDRPGTVARLRSVAARIWQAATERVRTIGEWVGCAR